MAGSAGFSLSRRALLSAGKAADTASGQMTASAQVKLSGATPQVISAHPGWQSSSALAACLDAWETRLKQLSDGIQQISQNLNSTADGYDQAERQILAEIRNVTAGLDAQQPGEAG